MTRSTQDTRWLRFSLLLVIVGVILVATAEPAAACAVCFGDPDSAMTQGMNKGIVVLLGVVAAVQIFFVAVFMTIRQRSREIEERKGRFQVLKGGVR
ncbi:MAG: hypothetical protein P8Y44_04980 [Acidobacteriota bacterium]